MIVSHNMNEKMFYIEGSYKKINLSVKWNYLEVDNVELTHHIHVFIMHDKIIIYLKKNSF